MPQRGFVVEQNPLKFVTIGQFWEDLTAGIFARLLLVTIKSLRGTLVCAKLPMVKLSKSLKKEMSFITLVFLLSLVPPSKSGFHNSSLFFYSLPKVPATIAVTHLSQDVKHYTRTLEPFQAAILLTVLGLTIFSGLVYRSLLLKNVYQLGCLRPIAAMTGTFESNILPFVVKLK